MGSFGPWALADETAQAESGPPGWDIQHLLQQKDEDPFRGTTRRHFGCRLPLPKPLVRNTWPQQGCESHVPDPNLSHHQHSRERPQICNPTCKGQFGLANAGLGHQLLPARAIRGGALGGTSALGIVKLFPSVPFIFLGGDRFNYELRVPGIKRPDQKRNKLPDPA